MKHYVFQVQGDCVSGFGVIGADLQLLTNDDLSTERSFVASAKKCIVGNRELQNISTSLFHHEHPWTGIW